MVNRIGNLNFDDDVALHGLESSKDIATATTTSMGGVTTTLTAPVVGGRSLSLVAIQSGDEIFGHFTLAQIEAIKSIAAAGVAVTLVHHRGTFNVLVLAVTDVQGVTTDIVVNPTPDHWYQATIQLIEV